MKLTGKITENMNITSEAENLIEQAVIIYTEKLARRCLKMAHYSDRKGINKDDVELVLKYKMI